MHSGAFTGAFRVSTCCPFWHIVLHLVVPRRHFIHLLPEIPLAFSE